MSRQSDVFIPAKMCFKIDGTGDNVDEHFDRLRTKNLNVKPKNFKYTIRNVALYSAWRLIFSIRNELLKWRA